MNQNGVITIVDDIRSTVTAVATMSELDQALTVLKETAARLNRESDSLNTIIGGIEEELLAANVGFEVSVNLPWLEDKHHVQLGWKRLCDQWCLVVRVPSTQPLGRRDEDHGIEDTMLVYREEPLLSASRHARILALQVLPNRVSQLAAAAEEAIETIEQAKKRTTQGEAQHGEKRQREIATGKVALQPHY
jgi:hypothetical protein